MKMAYSIRVATKNDIPKIVELWKGLMKHHENCVPEYIIAKDAEEKWRAHLNSFFDSDKKVVFVSTRSNEIVGYIFAMIRQKPPVFAEDRVGEIGDTFVIEDARRNGIGRSFVEVASNWLKEKGMKSIELNMYIDNPVANAFWGSMNFRPYCLTRRKKIKDDA